MGSLVCLYNSLSEVRFALTLDIPLSVFSDTHPVLLVGQAADPEQRLSLVGPWFQASPHLLKCGLFDCIC